MLRFFRRRRWDEERAREMQAHIDLYADDLTGRGWTPEAAEREARRRFGNPALIKEQIYEMNSLPLLEPLIQVENTARSTVSA